MTQLDRHYGFFSGIAQAALSDSLQDEYEREQAVVRIQKQEDDEEFNELLDHYHYQIGLKRKALDKVEELNNVVQQMLEEINRKNDELKALRYEKSRLETENQSLKKVVEAKESNNQVLNKKLSENTFIFENKLNEVNQEKNRLAQRFNNLQAKQKDSEQVFTLIQSKELTVNLEAMMALKVAYVQNKVLKKAIVDLTKKGSFEMNTYAKIQNEVLRHENEQDATKQGVSYTESVDWLTVNAPQMLQKILAF